jgi:hypothetical protein
MLFEDRRLWDNHNRLVTEDRVTRQLANNLRVETDMLEISASTDELLCKHYGVVFAACGLLGVWFCVSPTVKDEWQNDAILTFEKRNGLVPKEPAASPPA